MLCRGCCRFLWVYLLGLSWLCAWLTGFGTAQVTTAITPDDRLGTEINAAGNIYEITGGTRPHGGRNLFHGFDRFHIGTQDAAHFVGAPGIENIIGRVSGGERSEIDGRLSSDATLFLLNPQGIVFGPNASLDVQGSFYASTADEIRFTDGSTFRADPETTSTLTVAPPAAFGFLGGNTQPVEPIALRQSHLNVPAGETLSLVGGPIAIVGGRLQAPGGTLHVASVASSRTDIQVPLSGVGAGEDATAQREHRLGDVTLSSGTFLNTSGDGGGTIVIRGGALRMDRSTMTADNFSDVDSPGRGIDIRVTNAADIKNQSKLSAVASQAGQAGGIAVRADTAVTLEDSSITTDSFATGGGGDVVIEAPQMTFTDNASISTNTLRSGRGGNVQLIAAETLTVTQNAYLRSSSGPGGRAGDIVIHARGVAMVGDNRITGQTGIVSRGQDGHISIRAEAVTLANASIRSVGAAGDRGGTVTIRAQRVALTRGASMTTTANRDSTGGDIRVIAEDLTLDNATLVSAASPGARAGAVTLQGRRMTIVDRTVDAVQTGIFSSGQDGHIDIAGDVVAIANGVIVARSTPTARGGHVMVRAGRLELSDGASVSTSGSEQMPVGDVRVQVDDLALENASIFSRSDLAPGNVIIDAGGSISLVAQAGRDIETGVFSFGGRGRDNTFGQVTITASRLTMDGSTIGTPSRLSISVRAGNVNVDVGQLLMRRQALINTSTSSNEDAGMVQIRATNASLTEGARISAETTGNGNAGRIDIDVDQALILSKASQITSNTTNRGMAGSIDIAVEGLTLREGSEISTAASRSDGGNIAIQGRRVLLQDSAITTATSQGGLGGNVEMVTAGGVVVLIGSEIRTRADLGLGGNITIGTLLVDSDSLVDATGGVEDGEVELGTVVNFGAVTPLPQTFAADAPLFNEPCAQRLRGGQVSSFVVTGRDGLPADPRSALPMPMIEAPLIAELEGRVDGVAGHGVVPPRATDPSPRYEDTADAWLQAMDAYPCTKSQSEQTGIHR